MIPVHMCDPIENDSRSQATRPAAVEAVGLTLAHGQQVAVRDATFTVPAGASTALIGPNGSGKSTLLHAIAGLHPPREGTIQVLGGREVGRDEIAYVPQHLHANQHLPISAREVVTMGCYARRGAWGRLTAGDRAAVAESMARLDVTHLARRQLGSLSGGERQRVLVAQALAQGSPLLLLDEPLTGLDLPSQERIVEVIDEERSAGRTVVASTHSLADAASADHLLLLAGRVVASGSPQAVLTEANLSTAYGPMVIRFGERGLLLDDSTHHHPN
jgi:manganese transport system ATP-binding protein